MEIRIENLNQYPQYIETVVGWIYKEWGDNNPNYWKEWITHSLYSNRVPMTFIAFVDDIPAGTISLWNCDIQSRQDLSPWVGGLYVADGFRGQSYGEQKLGLLLQKHALKALQDMGYRTAYAFTEKTTDYYERIGWEPIGPTRDEKDNVISLLKMDLPDQEADENHSFSL